MKKKLTFSFLIVCLALSFPVQIQSAEQHNSEGLTTRAKAFIVAGVLAVSASIAGWWYYYKGKKEKTPKKTSTHATPSTANIDLSQQSIGFDIFADSGQRYTEWRYAIIHTLQKNEYKEAGFIPENNLSGLWFVLTRNNKDISTLNHLQENLIKKNIISADDAIYTIQLIGRYAEHNFDVPYYVAINPKTLEVKGLIKKDANEWIEKATQEEIQEIMKPAQKK